jgi:hypothetical protein
MLVKILFEKGKKNEKRKFPQFTEILIIEKNY